MPLDDAYAVCARLAGSHYENFPVASRLLPRRMRPHVAAVYAYARLADDIADEGEVPLELRQARLDEWLVRLEAAAHGRPSPATTVLDPVTAADAPHVFAALAGTMAEHRLAPQLLEDLVSAFRQDVTVKRYETWADLFDYCRRSANPVGRLVLRIAGVRDQRCDEASDAVCTALQLTNFWQDLAIDWGRGRLYLPAQEYRRTGAVTDSLDRGRLTHAWRDALAAAAVRTRDLFVRGRSVCDAVPGRLRWELRLTWLGGMRVLDRIEGIGFDVFRSRPTLSAADLPVLMWKAAGWRR